MGLDVRTSARWWGFTRPVVVDREEGRCQRCGGAGVIVRHLVPVDVLLALELDPFSPAECELICAACCRQPATAS